jgi:hypothetical protein
VHKQGRATRPIYINTDAIKTNYLPMVQLTLKQEDVDNPLNLASYPNFWVDTNLCTDLIAPPVREPTNPPVQGTISDEIAGQAFVTLVRWIASLFNK